MRKLPYWRLSGYYFFYFAFVGAFSPYFGLYLQSLSFSAWDIALLMSQMQLVRLFAPYSGGALADYLGQRVTVVRWAALFSGLGVALLFFAHSFVAVFVALALLAFFWSASLPLVETVTFAHLRTQAGRYSRIRLWGSIGFIVAVMITGAALDRLPLTGVLWAIAVALGGTLVCALAIPEAHAPVTAGEQPSISEIIRKPAVRAFLASCFAMSAAHGALYVFYSIHLAQHHYSKLVVGSLWSLGVLAEITVFFFMNVLLHRLGVRNILIVSFAAAVLRFAMIGWAVEWLLVLVAAQLLHGLTFGAYHAAAIAAVNRWFPGRCQARGQALYSSVSFGAGGLAGGLFSGWSWDRLGAAQTYVWSSAFAAVGLFVVVMWVQKAELDAPAEKAALGSS